MLVDGAKSVDDCEGINKRLRDSENEQVLQKRVKLDEQKNYRSIENVSTISENNFRSINLRPRKSTYTNNIKDISDTVSRSSKKNAEKADKYRCKAYFYELHGKYPKALDEWRELSKLPDSDFAFNRMGMLHLSGNGVEENPDAALRRFKHGADKMDVKAAFNLALTYDQLREKADTSLSRENYRRLACSHYDNVCVIRTDDELRVNTAKVNFLFLKFLNRDGAFAPQNLDSAQMKFEALSELNIDDARIYLIQGFIDYLINKKKKVQDYRNTFDFLWESTKRGNLVAEKIFSVWDSGNLETFVEEMEKHIKEPEAAYKQYGLYNANRL